MLQGLQPLSSSPTPSCASQQLQLRRSAPRRRHRQRQGRRQSRPRRPRRPRQPALPTNQGKGPRSLRNRQGNCLRLVIWSHLDFLWKWIVAAPFCAFLGKCLIPQSCYIDRKRKLFAASTGFWILLVYTVLLSVSSSYLLVLLSGDYNIFHNTSQFHKTARQPRQAEKKGEKREKCQSIPCLSKAQVFVPGRNAQEKGARLACKLKIKNLRGSFGFRLGQGRPYIFLKTHWRCSNSPSPKMERKHFDKTLQGSWLLNHQLPDISIKYSCEE